MLVVLARNAENLCDRRGSPSASDRIRLQTRRMQIPTNDERKKGDSFYIKGPPNKGLVKTNV